MSLAFLLPTKEQSQQKESSRKRARSQPRATTTSKPRRDPKEETAAVYLEKLSTDFIAAVNARDIPLVYSLGSKYFAEDIHSYIDDYCFATTYDQYLQNTMRVMHVPSINTEARNVKAHVDEAIGFATVFLSLEITGWPSKDLNGRPITLRRSSVGMMQWRRRNGEWRCFQSVTLRGMGMFGDMPDVIL